MMSWRSRRPTRTQLVALALVVVLAFGPIVVLVLIIDADSGPVAQLADGRTPPADGARVSIVFTAVSPTTGTVSAQVRVEPQPELLEDESLASDVAMRVNDARGDTTVAFPAGEPLRAVTVTLPLSGRSITRYPFDRYESAILMRLESVADEESDPVPIPVTVDVSSQLGDFDVELDDFTNGRVRAADAFGVAFELSRATTTTVYAVGIMILMWGLALAGVAVLWGVTIWGIEVPFWSVGYLVGVLFALPPLRASLPGSPPPGTLLDFVAFYWSVGLLGITLIVVMAVWLQRARPVRRPPGGATGAASPPEGERSVDRASTSTSTVSEQSEPNR